MRLIKLNGEPTIILLSDDDRKHIEALDSDIFIKPSVFPENAKVAEWKRGPKQLSLRERIILKLKEYLK